MSLIKLRLKSSKFAWVTSSLLSLLLVYLVHESNIVLGYKLVILSAAALTLVLNAAATPITKIDLLLFTHSAVIWQQQRQQRAEITQWRTLGWVAIILSLRLHNSRRTRQLLIFYDSCDPKHYKQLMRYIRWHTP